MINHRRGGLAREHQYGGDSTKSSRSLTIAASAVSVGTGAGTVGSSSKISNNGNLHESQHGKSNQSGTSSGKGPLHSSSNAVGVTPLMDYGKGGNNTCSGNSLSGVSNTNSLTVGSNIQSTQVIQNAFNRRKRSAPLLTEDRLMTLLLILVALWFLYVRYEETRAFDDPADKKKYHVASRYSLSEEYLPNAEKVRKYDNDDYSTKIRSGHPSGGVVGASKNVRLYHSFGDDDDSLTDSNLRGISLGDDQTEFRRDTDVYTPSDVRLKLVSYGGIDRGVFKTPTSRFSNRYSSGNKKTTQQWNSTSFALREKKKYPYTYQKSKNSTMAEKYSKPSSSVANVVQSEGTNNGGNTASYVPYTRTSTSKVVPTTHHPATRARPLNEYLNTGEKRDKDTWTTNSTFVTTQKSTFLSSASSNEHNKKTIPSTPSTGNSD